MRVCSRHKKYTNVINLAIDDVLMREREREREKGRKLYIDIEIFRELLTSQLKNDFILKLWLL